MRSLTPSMWLSWLMQVHDRFILIHSWAAVEVQHQTRLLFVQRLHQTPRWASSPAVTVYTHRVAAWRCFTITSFALQLLCFQYEWSIVIIWLVGFQDCLSAITDFFNKKLYIIGYIGIGIAGVMVRLYKIFTKHMYFYASYATVF